MENLLNPFVQITKGLDSITLHLGQTQFSVLTILEAILCFALVLILTRYFNNLLKKLLFHRIIVEKGIRDIVANLISYGTGTFVFIIILQSIGFNLSSLAVIGGALGIGIGLGLQDLTKNLASGLTLLAEQKIKIGDFIRFGEYEGNV
ncbi:MAG: mechanosensitive ion channel domain-containing protein, partial [Microcystaceae cyanobacterium]